MFLSRYNLIAYIKCAVSLFRGFGSSAWKISVSIPLNHFLRAKSSAAVNKILPKPCRNLLRSVASIPKLDVFKPYFWIFTAPTSFLLEKASSKFCPFNKHKLFLNDEVRFLSSVHCSASDYQ